MIGGEALTLGLYLIQQLGIMLGVGAATMVLVAQLVSARDGIIEPAEARFARMTERVLMVGLFLIVSSGVAITFFHSIAGQTAIIFSPAFTFKWMLIGIVALPLIVGHKQPFPPIYFEGFVGATWYALFVLHIVAPITTWLDLFTVYVGWVITFLLLWTVLARLFHATEVQVAPQPMRRPLLALNAAANAAKPVVSAVKNAFKQIPKPTVASVLAPPMPKMLPFVPAPTPKLISKPVTPPALKPVVKPAPPPPKPKPAPPPHKPQAAPAPHKPAPPPVPHKPALAVPAKPPIKPLVKPQPEDNFVLPAIRVMPRTQEDVDNQIRAGIVESN